MKKTTALPIYVSDSKELIDEKGRYVGRCVLSVTVRGNCVPKVYSGKDSVYPPNARGGEIRFVRYLEEADASIVEYSFANKLFKNRWENCRSFKKKMLEEIAKQRNKRVK